MYLVVIVTGGDGANTSNKIQVSLTMLIKQVLALSCNQED